MPLRVKIYCEYVNILVIILNNYVSVLKSQTNIHCQLFWLIEGVSFIIS